MGIVVKRTYQIVDGRCNLAQRQSALVGRTETEVDETNTRDEDDYPHKPFTDVILHGAAHTGRREASELVASIEVGPVGRRVRVHGDRSVEAVRGGVVASFSKPRLFSSVPLTHARSYGGFDSYASSMLGDETAELCAALGMDFASASRFTYPRNARGVGFLIAVDPERAVGTMVPNLEDPDDPVLPERLLCPAADRWYEQPIPGALDSILLSDFPRSHFFNAGPDLPEPVPTLREIALGAFMAGDLRPRALLEPPDARGANGAVPGLARLRLRGDEPVRLVHLHPNERELVFRLPGEVPELRLQPPGCPILELEPALDTVYLEPDCDSVSLIWSGSLQVASRYPPEELAQVEHRVRWP